MAVVVFVAAEVFLRLRDMPGAIPPDVLAEQMASIRQSEPLSSAGPGIVHFGPEGTPCADPASVRPTRDRPVAAYLAAGGAGAAAALARHCAQIDLVLTEGLQFDTLQGRVVPLPQAVRADIGRPVFVVAAPPPGATGAALAALLGTEAGRNALIDGIAAHVAAQPPAGVCLDVSDAADTDPAALAATMTALRERLDLAACLIAPADAALWGNAALVGAVDLAVARAFVPPETPTVAPAPPAWLAAHLARVTALVPGDKLVIALGSAGHVWQSGRAAPRPLGFAAAMELMAAAEAAPVFLPDLGTLRARMVDGQGRVNDIWLPDAAVIGNQLRLLDPAQAVAIWPLGAEDPALWALLDADLAPGEAIAALDAPPRLDAVALLQGAGPFVTAVRPAEAGRRDVTGDTATGEITAQHYAALPLAQRIVLGGAQAGLHLTFNGLPDAESAAPLFEALADAGVRAAFFVTLTDILGQEEMLARLREAGHEIGLRLVDQPLDHPAPALRQATAQLALVQVTGAGTVFARPAATLSTAREVAAIAAIAQAGYLPLAPGIAAPQGEFAPAALVGRVRDLVAETGAGTLVFDLGPNAGATARLLPAVIAGLAAEGFRFGTLSEAAGLDPAAAMPPPPRPPTWRDAMAVGALDLFLVGLTAIFLGLMIFAAIRALIFLGLALRRGNRADFDPGFCPPVTIIVPAYNEEVVIVTCIRSLLASDYPDLRIVVVDDGSTDRTYERAMTAFRDNDRVTLLHQANGGKWAAANHGLSVVGTPYFIIADADSMFFPDTVRWLVQPFRDDRVGAVAGLVEVGNRGNLLTACQALEYIVSQSVMRRAYEVFEGILVVPGAVGAWRTEAVHAARDFSGETITEDADLTVAVQRAGYRIRFQEQARAVTEAPEHVRAFLRQRLRWTFGMFQVSWKHRAAIAERRPVAISIVDAVWFGLFSSLLSPLVDLLLVLLIVKAAISVATTGAVAVSGLPLAVIVSYFLLTGLDVLNTLVAFRFERRFDWKLLALVPLLRFGYRQLLYAATINAIWHALIGHMAGWNKLDRTGAVLTGSADRGVLVPAAAGPGRAEPRRGRGVPRQEPAEREAAVASGAKGIS